MLHMLPQTLLPLLALFEGFGEYLFLVFLFFLGFFAKARLANFAQEQERVRSKLDLCGDEEEEEDHEYCKGWRFLMRSLAREALTDVAVPGFPKGLLPLPISVSANPAEAGAATSGGESEQQQQQTPAAATRSPKATSPPEAVTTSSGSQKAAAAPRPLSAVVAAVVPAPPKPAPREDHVLSAEQQRLVGVIAGAVEGLVAKNDSRIMSGDVSVAPGAGSQAGEGELPILGTTEIKEFFSSSEVPAVGMSEYLSGRLVRFGRLDPCRLLVALAYIQRMGEFDESSSDHPAVGGRAASLSRLHLLTSWSGHRLLLVASLLASKMYQDATFDMGYWAEVGGVELDELLRLEVVFLKRLRWRCSVSVLEYQEMARFFGAPESLEPSIWS